MATNLSVYVPNVGEMEALKAILLTEALVLGLYKTAIIPDGNTVVATLNEMPTGGGRAYAQKELTNDLTEAALAASKWFMYTNPLGKGEGAYHNAPLSWVLNAADLADANTVYGVFAYTWVLPFKEGSREIKVGDTVQATSGATGIVTSVCVQSGGWAAGTAAGYLNIKTKTGTFTDGENIWIKGEIATLVASPTAAGDAYSVGDLFKIDDAVLAGEGAIGVVLSLTGGDNSPVATIGTVPGAGGRNYTVAAGQDTQKITGGGNDALAVEVASLATAAYAKTNTGVTADAHKKVMAVWPYATGIAITLEGQTITFDLKMALATGT
jgi:hypothetical protein